MQTSLSEPHSESLRHKCNLLLFFLTIFKTDDWITKIPTEAKTAAQHCAPPPRLNMPSFIHDLNLWIQKDIWLWLWLLCEISLRASSCYLPNSPLMDDVKCAVLSIVPVVKNAENSWLRIRINSKSYPKAELSVKFKCRSIDCFFLSNPTNKQTNQANCVTSLMFETAETRSSSQ